MFGLKQTRRLEHIGASEKKKIEAGIVKYATREGGKRANSTTRKGKSGKKRSKASASAKKVKATKKTTQKKSTSAKAE